MANFGMRSQCIYSTAGFLLSGGWPQSTAALGSAPQSTGKAACPVARPTAPRPLQRHAACAAAARDSHPGPHPADTSSKNVPAKCYQHSHGPPNCRCSIDRRYARPQTDVNSAFDTTKNGRPAVRLHVCRRGLSTDLEQYDEGLVAGQAPVDVAKYFRSVSNLTTTLCVLCSATLLSGWHHFPPSVHVTSIFATSGMGSSQQVAAELEDEDPVGVRIPPVRDHSLRSQKPGSAAHDVIGAARTNAIAAGQRRHICTASSSSMQPQRPHTHLHCRQPKHLC